MSACGHVSAHIGILIPMAAPTMTNSMHSGPPGAVSQAWIEQSRSSVGVKTEPQATTAPPKVGELMGTVNRAGMSSAVNALLNKSAAEKRAGIADAGEVKVSSGPLFERAESNFSRVSSFGRYASAPALCATYARVSINTQMLLSAATNARREHETHAHRKDTHAR